MQLRRRELLKLGVFGSAALLLPAERVARTELALKNRIATSRLPAPFSVPLTTPPVLAPVRSTADTDFYSITQQAAAGRHPARAQDDDLGLQRHHPRADDRRPARGARRSSATSTRCRRSTRPCATRSGRRPTCTGRRRCRSSTATPATSRTSASSRTTVPERPGGADDLVPRPRGPHHRSERVHGARRRSTSSRTTSSAPCRSRTAATTCRWPSRTRCSRTPAS